MASRLPVRAPGGQPQGFTKVGFFTVVGGTIPPTELTPVAALMDLPGQFTGQNAIGFDPGVQGRERQVEGLGPVRRRARANPVAMA